MGPTGHIHIGDAVLLEEHLQGRALWQRRQAQAEVLWADGVDRDLLSAIAAISDGGGPHMSPLRVVGVSPDHDRMIGLRPSVVVVEGAAGVGLGPIISALGRRGGRFPVEVGCRLALWITTLRAWMPPVDELSITWRGALAASPVPRLASGPTALLRFLSPAEVRDSVTSLDDVATYRAGIVLYELLAGAPPFDFEGVGNIVQSLSRIVSPERVPLRARRDDLDADVWALVDEMVAHATPRPLVDVQAELHRHACSDEECARFLAGVAIDLFPGDHARDLAFFEEAAIIPEATTIQIWDEVVTAPARDVRATLRALRNRDARTD
jgi:hypothetical protein